MALIDEFTWHMENVPGVESVMASPHRFQTGRYVRLQRGQPQVGHH